jgi:hypothetical protein
MKHAIAVAAALLLAACTSGLDHKLDGTSEKAFQASLEKMRKSASPEDAKRLDDALRILAIRDVTIGFEGGILGAMKKIQPKSPESLAEDLMPQVNGRTGRDILEAAATRRREQGQRQLQAVNAEAEKLRKARAEKESAREFLARIQVQDARIGIGGGMAIMDFKVRNDSEEALASLFLRATVTGADGRALVVDEFTYKALPPIAPAQLRAVRLPSSTPGKWNSPELAKQTGLGLALSVENATTPAGQKLATSFTQKDAERLAALESMKPELEALAK